jgi:two-component system, OmpR family, sensor kinase
MKRKVPMVLRLALSFAFAMTALLAALGLLVYSLFERSVSESLDSYLRTKADGVVESITTFWQTVDMEGNPRLSTRRFDTAEDSPFFEEMAKLWTKDRASDPLLLNAAVEILDNKGRTISASHAIDGRVALPRDLSAKVLSSGPLLRDIRLSSGPPDQRAFRSLSLPVRYGPDIVYVIQVIVTLSRSEAYLARLRALLFAFIPIGFASAVAAGWAGASSSVIPLRHMVERIRAIGDRPGGLRLEEPRISELAELASSFNTMIDRVELSFEGQVNFFNDISHQLKTPLTVLKGEMELALRRDRDAEAYRRALEIGLEEVDHMSALIERMLTIARLDSGQVALRIGRLDLGAIVAEAAKALRPIAVAKGIELRVSAQSPVVAEVDEFWMREAIGNLVDNAIAHSPEGASVDVSLRDRGDSFSLCVRDSGPGVADRDRELLFTRFHRAEGEPGSGYGIGLAIVKSVVELHGGSVGYESAAPGSVFEILAPKIRKF